MKCLIYKNLKIFKRFFFGNDGSQKLFVYQPTLDTLELKEDKGTDYFTGFRLKAFFKFNFLPLHSAFLPNIKYFGYKVGIQFCNTPLVVEQSNYTT